MTLAHAPDSGFLSLKRSWALLMIHDKLMLEGLESTISGLAQ